MHFTKKRQNSCKEHEQVKCKRRSIFSTFRDTKPAKLAGNCVYLRASDIIHLHGEDIMANEPAANGCVTIDGLATKFGSEEALKFAKKLYIHGGNISNWNRIKRKTTPSSADEVSDSVQ